jgi:hypothetical protein
MNISVLLEPFELKVAHIFFVSNSGGVAYGTESMLLWKSFPENTDRRATKEKEVLSSTTQSAF